MIVEFFKSAPSVTLSYSYSTDQTYSLTKEDQPGTWTFHLTLQNLSTPVEKKSSSTLFDAYVENARCFKYLKEGKAVAHLQIGHQTWNNRMRVWDLLVESNFRGGGLGAEMIAFAKSKAISAGARMLVLETQSCNVPAINFYLKHGFELIGFELAHYTNEDVANQEFRLEFGFKLSTPDQGGAERMGSDTTGHDYKTT